MLAICLPTDKHGTFITKEAKNKGGGEVNQRFTITEVASMLGVSTKTLARWEKVGKIRRSKRDWRGWRVYEEGDVQQIKEFHEAIFETGT